MTAAEVTSSDALALRVLLVEDSRSDAELFEAMLEEHASEIRVIEHCQRLADALALLAEAEPFDCIVLDLSLPDADGLHALQRLTEAEGAPPIVVLTGRSDDAVAREALRCGAEDYLVKSSIDGERLERAISYAIERWAAKRELADRERELARTAAQLNHLALHDLLTGLPNRRLVVDRLGQAVRRAAPQPSSLAVLFIDVDEFKLVNDSYGHDVGDQVLSELAERLRAAVRPSDLVGRLGGDEFVVVCEGLAGELDAVGLTERLFAAVSDRPFVVGGERVRLSVSIGIALGGDPGLDADRLLQDADIAMYAAKQRGRARHAVFDETLRRRSRERLSFEQDLTEALESGGLEVHYQPQVELPSGRCYGVEALLRWQRPGVGSVPPPEIIDVAESTGLIGPLGAFVLEQACVAVAHAPAPLQVGVNVSPLQIIDGDFVGLVAKTLARTGLPAQRLCLELTETAVMGDVARVTEALRGLRGLGVRIALDDFGTGNATLGHLKTLPVDGLKIDRTFIDGLGWHHGDTRIVTAVTRLADAFGLELVAEGIETRGQTDALVRLGCAHGQGYFYGRPAPTLPELALREGALS